MTLLYKRPDSPVWYVTKTRVSTRTSNRKLAEEFARKTLTDHWRTSALGEEVHTWTELCETWLDLKSSKKSIDRDEYIIKDTTSFLATRELTDKPLEDITAAVIRGYGALVKARASAATADRHLACIRSMLHQAYADEWLVKVPNIELYKPTRDAPRWSTREQLQEVLTYLPQWAADIVAMGAETGMRYSNVAGLRWDWIDADGKMAHVPATSAKGKRTYTVPLSKIARDLLTRLEPTRSLGPYVFVREGFESPIPTIRYWWECAVEKAGLDGLTFHQGTRHSFASWHTKNKTPSLVLKELGGWSSLAMVERYSHLSKDDLAEYADANAPVAK